MSFLNTREKQNNDNYLVKNNDDDSWLEQEKKLKPQRSDILSKKPRKNSIHINYYAVISKILFDHYEMYKFALSKKGNTLSTNKGLTITEIAKKMQGDRSYPPDTGKIYDNLSRLESDGYIQAYHLIGKKNENARYHFTEKGFTAYSAYEDLKKNGVSNDLINGIEEGF